MSVFIRLKSCFHCFIPSSRSEWTTSSYSTCYSLSTPSLSWTFFIRRAFIINQTDFVLSLRIDYCPCGILPGVVPLGPKVVSIYIGHENRMLVKPRHQHINRVCGFLVLIKLNNYILGLHRCWWRMLETKCVNDNYKMLVTVLAIQDMSPTSNFSHQHPLVPNINVAYSSGYIDVRDGCWRQFNLNCLCKRQVCDAGNLNTTGDVVNSTTTELDSVILQYGHPIF